MAIPRGSCFHDHHPATPPLLPAAQQVQDSEEDEDGNPPKHCLVSGATRQELAGWHHRRISQGKARETFSLW